MYSYEKEIVEQDEHTVHMNVGPSHPAMHGTLRVMMQVRGERIVDASFFLLLNAEPDAHQFTLPVEKWGRRWRAVLDTSRGFIPPMAPDRVLETGRPSSSSFSRAA